MTEFLLYGLLAALGWGTGDFLNARSSRKTSPHNALVWTFGILALLWLGACMLSRQMQIISLEELGLALATGFFFILGDLLFLNATRKGKIAVAAPVLSLSAVASNWFGAISSLRRRIGWIKEHSAPPRGGKRGNSAASDCFSRRGADAFENRNRPLRGINGIAWFESLLLAYILPLAFLNRRRIAQPVVENFGSAFGYFIGF